MDLSKLDDEQIRVALKVIESARKHGLNPDFVLPMVNQESAFKSNAKSSAGALGPMQLMPGTAKDLGVDPNNVDENIDGGMRFLKGLVENKKLGGDPRNIFAAYNAGPNHKFFQTNNLADLPNETVNHVIKIMGAYGDNVPELTLTSTEAPKAAPEASAGVSGDSSQVENQYGQTLIGGTSVDNGKSGEKDNTAALEAGAVAGILGAKVAGGIETTKQALPFVRSFIQNNVAGASADLNKPATKAGLQNWLNAMVQSNGKKVNFPLAELERLTGQKIRTMGELGKAYEQIQEIKETQVTKPMVKLVPDRPGVFEETGRMTTSKVPGRPGLDMTPYEVKSSNPVKEALLRQTENAKGVAKSVLPSLGKVGVGALGGATAGYQFQDAYEDYRNEGEGFHLPSARTASKFLSGLGGLSSVIPTVPTQGLGLVLQAPEMAHQSVEAIRDLNRRRKAATREDTDRMLTNVDPMGNPMP